MGYLCPILIQNHSSEIFFLLLKLNKQFPYTLSFLLFIFVISSLFVLIFHICVECFFFLVLIKRLSDSINDFKRCQLCKRINMNILKYSNAVMFVSINTLPYIHLSFQINKYRFLQKNMFIFVKN